MMMIPSFPLSAGCITLYKGGEGRCRRQHIRPFAKNNKREECTAGLGGEIRGGEERGNFVCLFGMEIMEDEQMGLGLSWLIYLWCWWW